MAFSCKGCDKRIPGCHSTCPDYIREKAEHDELMEKIRKYKDIRGGLDAQRNRGVYAAKRHSRNSRKWFND